MFLKFTWLRILAIRILKDEDREKASTIAKDTEDSETARSTIEVLRNETVATATLTGTLNHVESNATPSTNNIPSTNNVEQATVTDADNAAKQSAEAKLASNDVYFKDNGSK